MILRFALSNVLLFMQVRNSGGFLSFAKVFLATFQWDRCGPPMILQQTLCCSRRPLASHTCKRFCICVCLWNCILSFFVFSWPIGVTCLRTSLYLRLSLKLYFFYHFLSVCNLLFGVQWFHTPKNCSLHLLTKFTHCLTLLRFWMLMR